MIRYKKQLTTLAVLLVLGGCNAEGDAPVVEQVEERVALVRTLEIEPEEVTDLAVLSADLLPRRRATLAAEVPGVIEELSVEMGDRVEAGRVLVRIDTRALRQQVAEAEALFVQAQDRYERAESLFERRSITKQAHIDAVAARDVAQARLGAVRLALEKSEVKAPWSGRVAAKRVEVGDYAAPGQPLLELVEVRRLKVRAPASAADVPYLRIGAPVIVRVDVLPGEEFEGEVVRLGAELDPDTRTLDVEAELDNPEGRLRPGMFGRMEIPRQTLSAALLVPLAAVVDFEADKVVYVVEDERARRQIVSMGPVVGDRVVVTAGVTAGDRVVVSGQQGVADGQRVTDVEES
ncbi:MAG: efflux RND transporter periplasmic adaptor subunit [Acidobacteria bacterium]|nr:MAG: efflux RND transporter periplasmic adaptor subunit [Acidobacteriota bacterium]